MLKPERRKKSALRHTRLRFGRREEAAFPPVRPFGWQTWENMDLSEYADDLIALKRRLEAKGMYIQIPKRDARWKLPDPIDFGESVSDIVIRNRGREPER